VEWELKLGGGEGWEKKVWSGIRVGLGKIVSKNLRWGLIFHAYSLLGSVVTVTSREDQETMLFIHPSIRSFIHPSSSQPNWPECFKAGATEFPFFWVLKIKKEKKPSWFRAPKHTTSNSAN